jgi:hypothetical protein
MAELNRQHRKEWRVRRTGYGWWLVRNADETETVLKTRDRDEAYRKASRLNSRDGDGLNSKRIRTRLVREHLAFLRENGVGLRQAAAVSGIKRETLTRIMGSSYRGIRFVRRDTADRILAVTASDAAGGALVDAAPSWELIGCLLGAGWSKTRIAEGLGKVRALQLAKSRIMARNARAVADLHRRAWTEDPRVRLVCRHEAVK